MSPVRTGTYSIVARDEASGAIGAAVQSHWFSVGSVVTWGRAGIGAVATQSVAEPAYGPRLLDRLEGGEAPVDALRALTAEDAAARFRQVAVVGADGQPAVHTGEGCIAYAGHQTGEGFSTQANMMASDGVWPAMAKAFSAARGPLARRMLAALEAGEAAGGDVRGRQSAALLVVPAEGEAWRREVELRVEDDAEPLAELARLLDLHDAYALAGEGDELAGQGRDDEASQKYRAAAQLAPDNEELLFWSGLAQMKSGELEAGADVLRRVIAANDGWRQLLLRLDDDLAPGVGEAREALGL
jgi:uncharacterized Ntn-hydrolase superfamily protein